MSLLDCPKPPPLPATVKRVYFDEHNRPHTIVTKEINSSASHLSTKNEAIIPAHEVIGLLGWNKAFVTRGIVKEKT